MSDRSSQLAFIAVRAITSQLLANWKITIEINTVTGEEERALIMALSPALLEWEQQ